MPDGYALKDPNVPSDPYGYKDLGPKGRANLKAWVQNGGRYVGWLDGGVLASALGHLRHGLRRRRRRRASRPPGSLFRVRVNDGSPLAAGVGPFAWRARRRALRAAARARRGIPLRYPDAGSSDFFVSGQADGAAALGGRPAATDERVGRGRVVAFGFDPNFRAFADGHGEAAAQRDVRRRPGDRAAPRRRARGRDAPARSARRAG